MDLPNIKVNRIETKNIMTKSNGPLGGYSVNPYVGCPHGCRFIDNETPYERVEQGHPTIVDYFYHEEVRGTENSGRRNK